MTAQEYKHVFLPRIDRAEEFVELFESSIEHMSETRVCLLYTSDAADE